ncbi:MAG: hypothetical protein IKW49_03020 [Opitutales bacterium]|nr:hypothetical protein [Opitutales bacterium]
MTTKVKLALSTLSFFLLLGTNAIVLNILLSTHNQSVLFYSNLLQNIEKYGGKLSEIENRVLKIESLRVDVPADLEKRVEARFCEVAEGVSEQTSKSIQTALNRSKESQALYERKVLEMLQAGEASVKIDQEKRREDYGRALALAESDRKDFTRKMGAIVEESANFAQSSMTDLSEKYTDALAQTVTNLNELAKKQLAGNNLAAQKAFERARELKREGKFEDAKIYCLNAIAHAPSEAAYFQELFEIQGNLRNRDSSEWRVLQAMLTEAFYRVNPETIPQMQTLSVDVAQKIEEADKRVSQEEEAARLTEAEAAKKELSEKYAWSSFDSVEEANRASWLRERYDLLDTAGGDEKETSETSATLSFYLHLADAEKSLAKAEGSLREDLVAKSTFDNDETRARRDAELASVASQLQVVGGILTQIWVSDFSEMHNPEAIKNTVSAFSERLLATKNEYSRQLSREFTKKTAEIWEKIEKFTLASEDFSVHAYPAENFGMGKITQKMRDLERKIEEFNEALAKVVCAEDIDAFQEKMKRVNVDKKIYELNIYRKVLYNKWAIEKIKEAHDSKDAGKQKLRLKNINQSLLNPAVSALFATVYGKLFSENVDVQIEITTAKKIGLEQF